HVQSRGLARCLAACSGLSRFARCGSQSVSAAGSAAKHCRSGSDCSFLLPGAPAGQGRSQLYAEEIRIQSTQSQTRTGEALELQNAVGRTDDTVGTRPEQRGVLIGLARAPVSALQLDTTVTLLLSAGFEWSVCHPITPVCSPSKSVLSESPANAHDYPNSLVKMAGGGKYTQEHPLLWA